MKQLLLYWMRKDNIDDKMLWKKAAEHQECFLRDEICTNLLHTHAFVVSTHRSKSIQLPVYFFMMHNGIKVVCRENFYGWMLSVKLPKDKPYERIIPKDLIECGYDSNISDYSFEGFRKEWVFEGYKPNDKKQRNFSFGIYSDYEFYTVMYMLKHLYGDMDLSKEMKNLTKEEIVETISNIYANNGYNEIREVFDNGHVSREMSGWEIMWRTYHQLDDYDFREKYNLDYTKMDICDNIGEFADEILKYPETTKEFVLEKKMYEMEY
jgi:hypothetical protein